MCEFWAFPANWKRHFLLSSYSSWMDLKIKPSTQFNFCWILTLGSLNAWLSVWPVKSRQMSIKGAQKLFCLKNERFWHLYKNWAKLPQALKGCPKCKKLPNLVTLVVVPIVCMPRRLEIIYLLHPQTNNYNPLFLSLSEFAITYIWPSWQMLGTGRTPLSWFLYCNGNRF